jgi:GNAT superfamily N-acetyltransferase
MIDLPALTEATWPAAATFRAGPWLIRDGQGGGKRVSAAEAAAPWHPDDLPLAEAAMMALGQDPLFVLRPDDAELDAVLAARGYARIDPVVAYAAPVALLAETPPQPMTSFPHWPPMGIATALWDEAGIGPERIAVMQRAGGPKTVILGRTGDRAAGVAFVACHDNAAMLHALEVTPALRRQGTAHNILRAAAIWAQDHAAHTLCLLVTEGNERARRLYASLGMEVVGHYHYRTK